LSIAACVTCYFPYGGRASEGEGRWEKEDAILRRKKNHTFILKHALVWKLDGQNLTLGWLERAPVGAGLGQNAKGRGESKKSSFLVEKISEKIAVRALKLGNWSQYERSGCRGLKARAMYTYCITLHAIFSLFNLSYWLL